MAYYILGFLSASAIGIFIWVITRRNRNSPGTIQRDIDRNNLSTGSGLEKLRDINEETARLNEEAEDITTEGLSTIENTNRTISDIIASASRKRRSTD